MQHLNDDDLFHYFMTRSAVRMIDLDPIERAALRSLTFAGTLSLAERRALLRRYEPGAFATSQNWTRMWACRIYYATLALLAAVSVTLGLHAALP